MSTTRPRLPQELGVAFSVPQARALGVSRSTLDHPELVRHFRGSRSLPVPSNGMDERPGAGHAWTTDEGPTGAPSNRWDVERQETEARIAALWSVAPPDAFFYGPTAAFLWHAPLPQGCLHQLHLAMPYPRSALHRPGVMSTRMRKHLVGVVDGTRYRALSAETTWATLARFLDVKDLVAVADFFVTGRGDPGGRHPERQRPPTCSIEQLRAALSRGK